MRSAAYNRTDPCRTPHAFSAGDEADDPVRTYWYQPTRYVSNHCSTIPDSPYEAFSRRIKISWLCRELRTNPATPVQIDCRRQWRAGCLKELSARRFHLSGQRDMRTGVVTAGRTCPRYFSSCRVTSCCSSLDTTDKFEIGRYDRTSSSRAA